MSKIPRSLEKEMHPLCDRAITERILSVVNSNIAVYAREVAKAVGCSDITAKKHLARIVKAGLATEKRVGKARVIIGKDLSGVVANE